MDVEGELAMARRDEQALWNHEKNLEIVLAARAAGGWYRGEKGTWMPKDLLSTILHPAGDGDKQGAHRLYSLARDTRQHMSLESDAFVRFRVSSYLVLDELSKVASLPQFERARRMLDEYFAYLERKAGEAREDELFASVIRKKAERYCAVCEEIALGFARQERMLVGAPSDDPYERSLAETADETLGAVKCLSRKLHHPPPSSRTRRWVKAKWEYYNDHPEALPGNVTRRRVYARDVWDAVKEEARTKYGIADLAAFRSILASLRQERHRSSES